MPLLCLVVWLAAAAAGRAKNFDVRDFRAAGDGRVNDGPALRKAIAVAILAGPGSEVRVPAGRYLLAGDGKATKFALQIDKAARLTIAGEPGATLIAAPATTFFGITRSSNVIVRGLQLDRAPLAYAQATIRSVNPTLKSATIAFDTGYDDFATPLIGAAKFFIVFTNPASDSWGDHGADCAWLGPNDANTCWPPSITAHSPAGPHLWTVSLNTAVGAESVGKTVVLWNLSAKGHAFDITGSSDILVEDVNYYPGGADGGFVLARDSGAITFRRLTVDVRPGSTQFLSAIGGAMAYNNHGRLTLDHVTIAHVWDDCLNTGANFARIANRPSPRAIIVDGRQANDFRAGDHVEIWDWPTKTVRMSALLASAGRDPAAPELWRLILDRDVAVLHTGFVSLTAHGNESDAIDRVIDVDSAAQLTVTHSRLQSFHARDLLVRGSNAVIEDNEFYDTVMAGILAGPEFTWNEGPRAENLLVRHNLFRNVSGSNILVGDSGDTTGIRIEQNRFVEFGRYRHGVMGDPAKPVLMGGK